MNASAAIEYIRSFSFLGSKSGLERIKTLLHMMGDPQNSLKYVHVAGTNGKGSFCAMLSSVLECAGYTAGLYSTPSVVSFCDCMRVNGNAIPDEELCEAVEFVRTFAERMPDHPTEYELLTAVAFEWFRRRKCDFVVLECCMGGRDDVTNVIDSPLLAVITGVSLDHTRILGSTVRDIARIKAGIIKRGSEALCGNLSDEAFAEISSRAYSVGASLERIGKSDISDLHCDRHGGSFVYENNGYRTSMLGLHQPYNAELVVKACDMLRLRGVSIPQCAVADGIFRTHLHARFELLSEHPVIVYDGAHNPEGAAAFVSSFKALFGTKCILVSGIMADKDYRTVASILSEVAVSAFTCVPDNPRALAADAYAECFASLSVDAMPCGNVKNALDGALGLSAETGLPVVGIGSLYMYKSFVDAIGV